MTYCCFIWSDSLASEVSCSSGSVRTSLVGHFACCTATDILCCLHCVLHASATGVGVRSQSVYFYMADVADEVEEHQVNYTYADDTQPYLHCRHYDNAAAVTRLETCLNGVSHWMAANRLKLNAEKTELLLAESRFSAEAQLGSKGPSVQFGTETVSASDHVRVLGVTFSSDLSLNSVCSLGFRFIKL